MKRFVDLSHTVEDGLITYKGLPAPLVCDFMSREESRVHYDEGTSFHIGKIEMVANTGTYIDAPFHRFADGKDVAELEIESLADLEGELVQVGPDTQEIDEKHFAGLDVNGKAVLVRTGWCKHWKTDQYFEGHPYLTEGAAILLRNSGVRLVGIDSYNIDDIQNGARPVHTVLLGGEIPIIEHMCNLDQLPESGFRVTAVPVKVKNFGTFPVRAYGTIDT